MAVRNKRRKGQSPPPAGKINQRPSQPVGNRRFIVLAGVALVAVLAVAAVVAFVVVRQGDPSDKPWSQLGTEDVHSLAFIDGDPQRLLFGHHGGILATADGGKTWAALATRSDAMGLGVAAGGSIVIAGHEVFAESRDGGQAWLDITTDLPSLDIHGFARDPGSPARMWVYLAIGGLWESLDGGRTWTQVQEQNIVFPVAVAAPSGAGLLGVTATGIGRSDDGGRTWRTLTDPELYPLTDLAATSDERIHSAVYRAAHNDLLEATLAQYYVLALRIWVMALDQQVVLRNLGARVRARRLVLGLSQEELAERAGLHRNYVGGIEQGRRNVAAFNLVRLAVALEVDPGDLLTNLHKVRR